MKHCFYLLALSFLPFYISGQCSGIYSETSKHELDDLEISHSSDMTLYSFNDTDSGYILKGDDNLEVPVIFQGALWMGGIDESGNLRVSAKAYTDFEDYAPGILDDVSGSINSSTCSDWDEFFTVSASDVNQVIADWDDNQMIDDGVPDDVLYYPGIGNFYFVDKYGWDLPAENNGGLAAFVDRDNDGKYNPFKGDYPKIRGSESTFWASNDRNADNDDYVGMEFLVTSAVNTDELALAFSSQMKIKAIYHGQENLSDFYLGIWMDGDLGCITNDMVGCLPDSNLIFYYGEEIEQCQEGEPFKEGTQPLLLFKHDVNDGEKMSSFISFNRANVSDEIFPTTDPANSEQVYNTLQGIWKDGVTLTKGNEGYNLGSTNVTKFQYDHSDNAAGGPWKACDDGQLIRDKRTLVNFGPFNLKPGDIFDIKFSVHMIEDAQLGCPSEQEILEICRELEQVISSNKELDLDESMNIYPNPFKDEIRISTSGLAFDQIHILDLSGRLVRDISTDKTNSKTLDDLDLNNGVYIIQVYSGQKLIATEKLLRF